MNKTTARLLILILTLIAASTATVAHANVAHAQDQPPPVPHAFYGAVEVNGQPAPVGTQIEAKGTGVKTGVEGNPLTVTVAGQYGGPSLSEAKLGVQGTLQEEAPIEFYVNGVRAECARPGGEWQTSFPFQSGVVTLLNLRVSQESPAGASPTPTATVTPTGAPTVPATPTATSTVIIVTSSTATPTAPPGQASTQQQPTATRQLSASGSAVSTATPTLQPAGTSPTTTPSATPAADGALAVVATPTGSAAAQSVEASAVTPVATSAADAAPTAPPTAPPAAPPAAEQAEAQVAEATPAKVAAVPHATGTPLLQYTEAEEATSPAREEAAAATTNGLLPLLGMAALVIAGVGTAVVLLIRRSA